ncbi:MerR family transcriptional regulator [Nocardiopsis alborubida]|uniref:MerR family transcriptional regulator n=1 Tax=Nocardiopsis alborubida TaxID=146802 RepID=A0A7X6RS70_9ACTN|nr:MerR family transcriptional regulator [Nocardiopsis alborubida]NKZ00028.1 MerR family transcriptional regulator [Nocardiopsis alborubida]
MRIGEVAERAGVSRRSLRYYEQQGLIEVRRSPSGQRLYEEDHVRRVRLIQTFYAAKLTSATIAELVPCMERSPSRMVAQRAQTVMERERGRLRVTIEELSAAVAALDGLIDATAAHQPEPRSPQDSDPYGLDTGASVESEDPARVRVRSAT